MESESFDGSVTMDMSHGSRSVVFRYVGCFFPEDIYPLVLRCWHDLSQ